MTVVRILMCVIILPFWIKLGIEVGGHLTGSEEYDFGKYMYYGLAYAMATIVLISGSIALLMGD